MPKREHEVDSWFKTLSGQFVLEYEAHTLAKIINSKWGDHLVQIEGPDAKLLRAASPIIHQVCLKNRFARVEEASLVLSYCDELALLPNSVDLILLPHVLEGIQEPQPFFDDLYQALKAEGLLILTCLNPVGFGVFWRFHFLRNGWMPKAKWWMGSTLKEALQLAGFTEIQHLSLGFEPTPPRLALADSRWEKGMRWLCPTAGAITLLYAKKQELEPLRTIEWSAKPSVGVLQSQSYERNR